MYNEKDGDRPYLSYEKKEIGVGVSKPAYLAFVSVRDN